MIQTIKIDNIPPNLNLYRNMHYRELDKQKKEWCIYVKSCVRSQSITPVVRVRQTYEFWFKDRRRHDPDNYAACAKWINDGLVAAGILPDDDFEHIKSLTSIQGGISKKPYVLVHLEEIA